MSGATAKLESVASVFYGGSAPPALECCTCATLDLVAETGLRDLRQNASDIIRRVESGETFTVTVNGRPAARIVPAERSTWLRRDELDELFSSPTDPQWGEQSRDLLDQATYDPFER